MRLFKNIAVRFTALLLFFAMIAAVILYQAGVYDISFIERPVQNISGDEEISTDNDVTHTTDTVGTLPPAGDDESMAILDSIKPLNELLNDGWSLYYDKYSEASALASIDFDFSGKVFSLRDHTETKTVLKTQENGRPKETKVSITLPLPQVRLYFGFIVIDDGEKFDIYNSDGKELVSDFSGTFVYARSYDGLPVVKIGSKYYEIDTEKGLVKISESDIHYKALNFDSPRYYAKSDTIKLYPYSAVVDIYTYIGDVESGTSSSDNTSSDGETAEPDSTESDSSVSDSTNGETVQTESSAGSSDSSSEAANSSSAVGTDSADSGVTDSFPDETSDEASSDNEIAVVDLEDGISENGSDSDISSSDTAESTAEDSETSSSGGSGDDPAGSGSNDDAAAEDTSSEDASVETALPDGVVIKDGKYYKVTKGLRYGYRDKDGNVVISPGYAYATDFTPDGLAAVTAVNGAIYFINEKAEIIIPIIDTYTYPKEFNYKKHIQRYTHALNRNFEDVGMYYFDNGHVLVRYILKDAYTDTILYYSVNKMIDTSGNVLEIPGNYTVENYSDGVMLLSKDGKYGYMDTDLSWVCPAVFTSAEPFVQGLAVAESNGKFGMIDTDGNTVLPFCFDYISNVSDGKIAAYSAETGWRMYAVVNK